MKPYGDISVGKIIELPTSHNISLSFSLGPLFTPHMNLNWNFYSLEMLTGGAKAPAANISTQLQFGETR